MESKIRIDPNECSPQTSSSSYLQGNLQCSLTQLLKHKDTVNTHLPFKTLYCPQFATAMGRMEP